MKKDMYHLSVSTQSGKVIDSLNHFHSELLIVGKGAGEILGVAKEYPDEFLIQCYAAAVLLFAQDDTINSKALSYLNRAETLLGQVSDREKLIFQAVKAWYHIDYQLALTLFNDIISQWPTDCTSAKMAEWLYYCTGQPYNAKPFLAMCEKMHIHCKMYSGFLATHSFALELNGRYQAAMDMAVDALNINPNTPWAHHTVGHVTLNTSKIDEGIKLYHQYAPVWENILPLLRGHLYWHYSLYYVAKRDEPSANAQYQGSMYGVNPDTVLEQIDVISYLWRMDMAGMPQDKKLKELVTHIGRHPFEFYMPFANAHYMYALSRTGNRAGVQKLLEMTQQHASKLDGNDQHLWQEITLPLLHGIAAFGQEDYQAAANYLGPIMSSVTQVGGSDAQDELFYQAYLVSLLKSGQTKTGHEVLGKRLAHYKPTALGQYWNSLEKAR